MRDRRNAAVILHQVRYVIRVSSVQLERRSDMLELAHLMALVVIAALVQELIRRDHNR